MADNKKNEIEREQKATSYKKECEKIVEELSKLKLSDSRENQNKAEEIYSDLYEASKMAELGLMRNSNMLYAIADELFCGIKEKLDQYITKNN